MSTAQCPRSLEYSSVSRERLRLLGVGRRRVELVERERKPRKNPEPRSSLDAHRVRSAQGLAQGQTPEQISLFLGAHEQRNPTVAATVSGTVDASRPWTLEWMGYVDLLLN